MQIEFHPLTNCSPNRPGPPIRFGLSERYHYDVSVTDDAGTLYMAHVMIEEVIIMELSEGLTADQCERMVKGMVESMLPDRLSELDEPRRNVLFVDDYRFPVHPGDVIVGGIRNELQRARNSLI